MKYGELRERLEQARADYARLEEAIDPPWIGRHVLRFERSVAGSILLDRTALDGEILGQLQVEQFSTATFAAILRTLRIDRKISDAALLRAARRQCRESWEPVLIYEAAEQTLAWHSEWYAMELQRAWNLRDMHAATIAKLKAFDAARERLENL